ncbi:MAG: outer membrane protein assembly factor BamD [Desulfobacteraceae bacterium]|nr:outer membrane protein assembly factor BamD [Desulfobacteraceae bacterium]
MKNSSIAAVLCVFLLIGAVGCAGWFGKKQEKTATELAEQGDKYFRQEDYNKAIKSYERLRDWYPYSPHVKKAELRIADAHYNLGKYEQALSAYEYYERMHPSDSEIPYVIYRIGMCHYERIKSIDRTQVPTQKALEVFNRLRSRFPESEYAQKSVSRIEKCRKRLAGHEFYVGRFYFKSEHFQAALKRFEKVAEKYPDVEEYSSKAGDYIKRCRQYLAEIENREGRDGEEPPPPPTGPGGGGFDRGAVTPEQ